MQPLLNQQQLVLVLGLQPMQQLVNAGKYKWLKCHLAGSGQRFLLNCMLHHKQHVWQLIDNHEIPNKS